MSAFDGLLALRRYSLAHPEVVLADVITAVKHVSVDDAYHDYETALVLERLVPRSNRWTLISPHFIGNDNHIGQNNRALVGAPCPFWAGPRESGSHSHELQCLNAASLFSSTPTAEIRKWWDELSQVVRATDDAKRLEQGPDRRAIHNGLRNETVIRAWN